MARELEKMGAHFLAIKDMAGICRPFAARKLVKTLKEEVGLPIHFHTHDTSGIECGQHHPGQLIRAWTSSIWPLRPCPAAPASRT